MRGHSVLRHASIFSSSRSTARCAGRCRLHPRYSRRTVQVWVCEYRTPVIASITSATRSSVHISVANPWSLGPGQAQPPPRRAGRGSTAADGRPARPRSRPHTPPTDHALCHRDAVCADTPNTTTTSTCRLPASNISAARIRRSRNASKSRRAAARLGFRPFPPSPGRGTRCDTHRFCYATEQTTLNDSPKNRKIFNCNVALGSPLRQGCCRTGVAHWDGQRIWCRRCTGGGSSRPGGRSRRPL